MLVAVDIGNSNIVIAVHDGMKWVQSFRIYSDQKKTSDEYFVVLDSLMSHAGLYKHDINRAVISSVVPNLTRSMQKNIIRLFDVQPLMVDHKVETGLRKETIPAELGSDLLANAAQAHYMYPEHPVVVVDFGTALTLTTVDSDGSVLGASIAPGLVTAVNALFGNTAQLPQVELKVPPTAIGRNSQESIRSGIMFGYAGMVKAIIERTEQELGREVFVIATGGLSQTIAPLIDRINQLSAMHTLDGLRLISDLN
ncbi:MULTISPECIES: type III pantothenate kinase [Sphaerochaeta]|jgi:type III pantothenate kinase|uniref:Type III pantothenate kinase n=2 Tax=root TaxID=1 RepID=A0ABY4DEC4_9SPIR|nr:MULTISPECIES: type III pantothenate kinase [Sphaerochaeta]MDT3358533.1 type III pantothenate kinase [Spirochaetota bacterium]MDD2394310.1 type III pantothenate kinase [Sphaerochaeta sp.]MDD3423120.1 type III pantothenate kinase [Sphaerochaeta sp.]MDD3455977.1 type III pantothenate kinase [Sphaerochaeta sp.]MDD4449282.1 type III pantothenate kinase [Sphaerochaeta sp.]